MAIGTPTSIGTSISSNSDGTSVAFTTNANALVGNVIIVTTQNTSGGATTKSVTSITDSAGNTYAAAAGSTTTNGGFRPNNEIWYAVVTSQLNSGSTITVNYNTTGTGGNGIGVQAVQVSGLSASPLDKTATYTTPATTTTTVTATTLSQADEIVFVASSYHYQSNSTFTEESGYTTLINRATIGTSLGAAVVMCLSYKIVAATTAPTYATGAIWGGTPNIASLEIMATFKAATAATTFIGPQWDAGNFSTEIVAYH